MHRFVCAAIAVCAMFAGGTVSSSMHAASSPASAIQPKPRLDLSQEQRQQVLAAVNGQMTDDKLPAGFKPTLDAKVPSQKKLPLHPLPRPLVYRIPALKQYYYAKLPKNVLIVDPMTKKVVAVIAR